jgi:hypothetical protein
MNAMTSISMTSGGGGGEAESETHVESFGEMLSLTHFGGDEPMTSGEDETALTSVDSLLAHTRERI